MTIKWKITLSLVVVSMLLVISYVYTAQKIFQDDKISYIYENQQSKVETFVSDFNKEVGDAISLSRFFVREHFSQNEISSDMRSIFSKQDYMESISIYKKSSRELTKIIAKSGDTHAVVLERASQLVPGKTSVQHLQNDQFLISLPIPRLAGSQLLIVIKYAPNVLSTGAMQFLLVDSATIVRNFGANYIDGDQARDLISKEDVAQDAASTTTSRIEIGSKEYLMTSAPTQYLNLRFFSLIDEGEALKALGELLDKTVIYVIISILITFIVSLLLSNSITYRMSQLTLVAEEIGKGDFDTPIQFESHDEVGVLAKAFQKMAREIKQLFAQKIEKDRMERELKTAAIIQERLFPSETTARFGDYQISGHYITSTECGGDWWFYYQSGFDLYFIIADATGHGIPAALITSASNAIFSHIKDENYSLEKIVALWDEAVYQSSKGEVFMTAQLVRMNMSTGDGELINLGHDPAVLYRGETAVATYLKLPSNFSLGDRSKAPPEIYTFHLEAGDQLLLYSDGVLAMMDDDNNFSDKQYLKKLATFFKNDTFGEGSSQDIFDYLRKNSKRTRPGFDDDVTLVRLFRGTRE